MYDTHYDLLTILYVIKNKEYIDRVINNVNSNLIGLNANLYFMNPDEMKNELGIIGDIDVYDMFKKSVDIYNSLDIKSKVIFSIEGCDYIKDIYELERLYNLGLRAILLVWNNENRYGSGIKTDKGLTSIGREFIQKAIDLNMGIDLSHANEKTFYGIIDVLKNNKGSICYASHSNIYDICNNPRNLKYEQLIALKEVGGYLGLVMHPPFITDSLDYDVIKSEFLKHVKYAVGVMGIDRVCIASDNLEFYDELKVEREGNPFKQYNIKDDLNRLLRQEFSKEEVDMIMYKNALSIYERINCSNKDKK